LVEWAWSGIVRRGLSKGFHCERSEAIQSGLCQLWIAASLRSSQ
jgi:hypothetical protein